MQQPNRQKISSSLLDKCTIKAKKSLAESAAKEDAVLSLMQDGWSSTAAHPIIGSSIQVAGQVYLLSAENAGCEHKTAAYCAEKANLAIQICITEYGKKVRINHCLIC
jgi:hypothetical protein